MASTPPKTWPETWLDVPSTATSTLHDTSVSYGPYSTTRPVVALTTSMYTHQEPLITLKERKIFGGDMYQSNKREIDNYIIRAVGTLTLELQSKLLKTGREGVIVSRVEQETHYGTNDIEVTISVSIFNK